VRRRDFIGWLASSVALMPLPARAQLPASKVHRVGWISQAPPVSRMTGPDPIDRAARAFVYTLRELGYVEGRNLILERRSLELRQERSGEIVAELAGLGVDVIVTSGNEMAREAARVAPGVSIVMALSSGPVEAGLVKSLARPGGNVTGLTVNVGPEIEAKRLQMLKEAVPSASRIAFLGDRNDWEEPRGKSVRAAAATLGVSLIHTEHSSTNFADALISITQAQPHALFVARNGLWYANAKLLADFGLERRLPGTYPFRDNVEAGGLMTYVADLPDLYRRAAGYVDKILKGAKPGDLPVEQPTKFELVINLKTAKALGITVPPSLLARADEVIE
jgi:putative ABC transport system substrate-binding protein